jgi:hypothetical protein
MGSALSKVLKLEEDGLLSFCHEEAAEVGDTDEQWDLAECALNSEVAQDARIIPRPATFLRENAKEAPIRDSCLLHI